MQSPENLSDISEDDHLRSDYMRGLIQDRLPIETLTGSTNIPKLIVQFWHNLNALPPDVLECLDSWQTLIKQGFKRVLFDDAQAKQFINHKFGSPYVTAFDQCGHPAMRCDYFRLCYILIHEGFYIDADEVYQGSDIETLFLDNRLKIQPLCYDNSSNTMVPAKVFIGNRAYSPDWIFYANNNPLIAPAFHPIIQLALERSTRILLEDRGKHWDI
jgi:hypothetical protein